MANVVSEEQVVTISGSLAAQDLLPFSLQEVEQVRLLLRGGSVVDWRQLAFRDQPQVDQFLRLAGCDPTRPDDLRRLGQVHATAVEYLERTLAYRLLPEVADPDEVRDLFLLASEGGRAGKDACVVLKTMHVVHHLAGRELLYRLPVAPAELFYRVENRVYGAIDGLKSDGIAVTEFSGGRKTRDSIITKLLCKEDTHSANVHDRLRFRVVTETLSDLFSALAYLTTHLFPFNYVLPGESRNDLVDFAGTLINDPRLRALFTRLQRLPGPPPPPRNAFSSSGYQMINFVIDMPVRVDDLAAQMPNHRPEDGVVVFVLVEFQLCDQAADRGNHRGPNRHALYQARKEGRVRERLLAER